MTDSFEVAKWSHPVEVAEAPCGTCGQTVLYNLAAKVVVHAPAAVDPCDAPWPDEPRPAWVTAQIEQAEADLALLRRADEILPTLPAPALGLEPHHAAARERTDGERSALTPNLATGGVVESDVTGDEPPPWLTTCAYDSGGFLPPGLAWYRNDTGAPVVVEHFGDDFAAQINARVATQ